MIISNKQQQQKRKRNQNRTAALTPTQKQQVRQLIQAEIESKSFYFTTTPVAVTTGGTVYRCTTIPQGVTNVTRVGDKLHLKRLSLRYNIQVGATGLIAAADEFNTVRVIIFKWREDDGIFAPAINNILQGSSSAVSTNQHYNYDDKHLYKILYDKSHVVFNTPIWNGAAVAWYHGTEANYATPVAQVIKGGQLGRIEFDVNTSVGTGHLYILLCSDSAFAPNPTAEVTVAVEYDDG
jgi:hypothetical protein